MSAIFAPVIQPVSAGRFLALAIPALLIWAVVISTVSIDRNSIVAEDTAVEPSPSSMF